MYNGILQADVTLKKLHVKQPPVEPAETGTEKVSPPMDLTLGVAAKPAGLKFGPFSLMEAEVEVKRTSEKKPTLRSGKK